MGKLNIINFKAALLFSCFLFFQFAYSAAGAADITGVRTWQGKGKQQFVFDISKSVKYKVSRYSKPDRLVIDLKSTRLKTALSKINLQGSAVKKIRSGVQKKGGLRIVFDLSQPVKWKASALAAKGKYGKRLLVELVPVGMLKSDQVKKVKTYSAKKKPSGPHKNTLVKKVSRRSKDVIVAIDAGHGGKDPGATGTGGTHEKDIVLAIARELKRQMNKVKGLKAVLIRDGDYFVKLKKRRELARDKYNADVFISIHADAFKNSSARGASVFILSQHGASSATASYLADRENKADFIGGYVKSNDEERNEAILSVAMDGVLVESNNVGHAVLTELKQVSHLHKDSVEQAGFMVLKSPDILSILVETGFITNRKEEKLLKTKRYQRKIAKAIVKGTQTYLMGSPIPGTYYAERKRRIAQTKQARHVVSNGETLSGIAATYLVSLANLRRVNAIRGDKLQVGKVLLIPQA